MKKWIFGAFFLLIVSLPAVALAQAPYTGGTHDGYAKFSFALIRNHPFPLVPVSISPNPVQAGNRLRIRANNVRNKVDIRLHTLLGQQLRREVAWGIEGSYTAMFSTDGIPAGIYLLEIILDGKSHPQKIVVTSP